MAGHCKFYKHSGAKNRIITYLQGPGILEIRSLLHNKDFVHSIEVENGLGSRVGIMTVQPPAGIWQLCCIKEHRVEKQQNQLKDEEGNHTS